MRPLDTTTSAITLPLAGEAATASLARALSRLVAPGDVIALFGDLGAGKTSFARAFINALPRENADAVESEGTVEREEEEVPSPTFTLVQLYERVPATIWHFDLYRLEQAEEVYELGIEEAFADGISLIEWPERLGGLLPADRLEVHLGFGSGPDARTAALTAFGSWTKRRESLAALQGDLAG
ncbi:tRNA (adenosine(37)-N6)-threonylcarbamoyltransferase complex ATPase subunit type 1 TsaE [Denitrobaculum tricleocarpae]|uniref:tRNA threonylcarbamoyladenosine biosynthesis protein TsaE n=1 Tax=Denitrobaculum tricleocarpae TaxID=2591009 RepID=A0A545TG40_9PROT|nr:tRNA (adenosine(37)-N6)-threonylcarbamoyltransferase complex ATPase subunit type 1 TsaE [Denitrobaculum tricleocarpae]TQV76189.1 tRNA (adenosine(37)-N6)-threonylcarbamoyltransferase complex ATPase subunit type 1 TsaE [Denitrobaculum tricleocarpae]